MPAIARTQALALALVHDECERYARQQQKYGRRNATQELRDRPQAVLPQVLLQERMENVALQDDENGDPAPPIGESQAGARLGLWAAVFPPGGTRPLLLFCGVN